MKSVLKISLVVILSAALLALFTLPSATPAAVPTGETATNGGQPIRGDSVLNAASAMTLTLVNDSPTPLGETTTFTAAISETGAVTYTWAFGDGAVLTENNATAQHVYTATGNYTATVTATVGITSVSATSAVTITEASRHTIVNLPLILRYPGVTQPPILPVIDLFQVSFGATYAPYIQPTVITGCNAAYVVDALHVVDATFTWAIRGATFIKFIRDGFPATGGTVLKADYVSPDGVTDELTVTITKPGMYLLYAENLNGEIPANGSPGICFVYKDLAELAPPYDLLLLDLPVPNSPLTITWQQADPQDIIAGFSVQRAPVSAGDDQFIEIADVSKTDENQIVVGTALKYFTVDSMLPLCDIKYRVTAYYVQEGTKHYSPPSASVEYPCLR